MLSSSHMSRLATFSTASGTISVEIASGDVLIVYAKYIETQTGDTYRTAISHAQLKASCSALDNYEILLKTFMRAPIVDSKYTIIWECIDDGLGMICPVTATLSLVSRGTRPSSTIAAEGANAPMVVALTNRVTDLEAQLADLKNQYDDLASSLGAAISTMTRQCELQNQMLEGLIKQ